MPRIELTPSRAGPLRIWDDPRPKLRYVMGADVAEGKIRDRGQMRTLDKMISYDDRQRDYSAIAVIEEDTADHVASWMGGLDTTSFANVVCALGNYYNNAHVVVELNGPGIAVIQTLAKTLSYPNLYRNKNPQVIDSNPVKDEFGWRSSVLTRPLLIDAIHQALNEGYCSTRDEVLLDQLRTMQIDPNGQPRAMGRDKDDLVFAYALALRGRLELLVQNKKPEEQLVDQRLSPQDRRVWQVIRQQMEATEHDRNRSHRHRVPSFGRFLRRYHRGGSSVSSRRSRASHARR